MLIDIQKDLDILQSFFIRQAVITTTAYGQVQATSEEDVEAELFAVSGPASIEDLVCRLTVAELNTLIEASIQQGLALMYGSNVVKPSNKRNQAEHLFNLPRTKLEERYVQEVMPLNEIEGYHAIQEIKEICEGLKHRQRTAPTLKWDKSTLISPPSLVLETSDGMYRSYDLCFKKVSEYLAASKTFIESVLGESPIDIA